VRREAITRGPFAAQTAILAERQKRRCFWTLMAAWMGRQLIEKKDYLRECETGPLLANPPLASSPQEAGQVVSVTSDVTGSASYQSPAPKLAQSDASQLAGGFASLVDNTLPSAPSNLLPPAPEPPAPQRASRNQSQDQDTSAAPAHNSEAPADNLNAPSNDTQGPANQNPPPASASDNSSTANQTQPASTPADHSSKGAQQSTTTAKDGTSKTGSGKSTDKSVGGSTTKDSTDSGTTTQPAGQVVVTPNPIAALLPTVSAIVGTPTTIRSGNANAPLAIAAAALTATTSATAALTVTAGPTKTGGATNGTTTANPTAAGKTPVQGVAADAKATTQLTPTDASTSADVALLAAAGTPGATKANTTGSTTTTTTTSQTKTTANAATGVPTASDASATAGTANATQNGATPQLAVNAKPDTNVMAVDAVKPDGNGASTTPTTATADHSPAVGNPQAPAPVVDASAQVAAVPQQLSAATPVVATDKLTATLATGAAVPVSGLAVTIAATAQSGKTSFELRLDPADLGRIDVRINVDSNGQVTSHLTVDKPETLSILQQDAPQLQQALNDAGLKTGSGGLQFSLRDQSSSGQNNTGNQNGAQPQRLVVTQEDPVPAVMAGRSYGRMLRASGGVDIRV